MWFRMDVRNSIELGWRYWSIVGVTSYGPGADYVAQLYLCYYFCFVVREITI